MDRHHPLLAIAACCLSLAAQGCSCNALGCASVVTIAIVSSTSQPFPDGRYTVDAKLDGASVRAQCTLTPTGSRASCDHGNIVLSRSASGGLEVGLVGTPKHIDMTLSSETTLLTTTSFDPQYSKPSNEDSCGPHCVSASHVATTK